MIIGCGPDAIFEYGALTTVDLNSQKVFRNAAFSWSKRFTLASSATQYIIIDPTALSTDKTLVILPVFFQGFGAGPIFVDLHANPTYSNEVEWTASNRDGRSVTTPETKVYYIGTATNVTDEGPKLAPEFMIPSNGVPAVSSFGGQTKDDLILIANPAVKYMFKLDNQESNAATCVFAMSVFEATEGF